MTAVVVQGEKRQPDLCFCPFCFRIYEGHHMFWIQQPRDIMQTIQGRYWRKPPYQSVIENMFYQCFEVDENISICCDCSSFMRKNVQIRKNANVYKFQKSPQYVLHPVHIFVDFIISGTCSLKPCSSVVLHCLESLLYQFPRNPMLVMEDASLYLLIGSIRVFNAFFSLELHDFAVHIPFLKWLWIGAPILIDNTKFAKKIRKYVSRFPGIYEKCRSMFPHACRHCSPHSPCPLSSPSVEPDFLSMLVYGDAAHAKIAEEVHRIEEYSGPVDFVSFYCEKCCRLSILRPEYEQCLYTFFELESKHLLNESIYFENKIRMFKKKQKGDESSGQQP